jgi:hypothetical protein
MYPSTGRNYYVHSMYPTTGRNHYVPSRCVPSTCSIDTSKERTLASFRDKNFLQRKYFATKTRARVVRVRAEYPNQLDYSGVIDATLQRKLIQSRKVTMSASIVRTSYVGIEQLAFQHVC